MALNHCVADLGTLPRSRKPRSETKPKNKINRESKPYLGPPPVPSPPDKMLSRWSSYQARSYAAVEAEIRG